MAETIVDGTLFNVNNIKYTAPKANPSGGKSINILNKTTSTGLRLATPLMLTWGASDFEGNKKFDFALQFPTDEYKNVDTDAFLKNLIDFEEKLKADALIYSKEWFGKQHKSAEVVEALWSPMLKYSKNKETGEPDLTKSPSIRVKLPVWEGVWKSEIYDEDYNKMFPDTTNPSVTPLDFIQKGIHVACILQSGGLWFANGKFGITWKLIQAVAQKPRETLAGKCFLNLKSSDKEKLKNAPQPERLDPEDFITTSKLVEDSDNEEELDEKHTPVSITTPPVEKNVEPISESSQETPVAVEEKVVKKKVVKKKVVTEA